jgi:hypothetical protein
MLLWFVQNFITLHKADDYKMSNLSSIKERVVNGIEEQKTLLGLLKPTIFYDEMNGEISSFSILLVLNGRITISQVQGEIFFLDNQNVLRLESKISRFYFFPLFVSIYYLYISLNILANQLFTYSLFWHGTFFLFFFLLAIVFLYSSHKSRTRVIAQIVS